MVKLIIEYLSAYSSFFVILIKKNRLQKYNLIFTINLNFCWKKATYTGNKNPIALNYNFDGNLNIILPQGPSTDDFKLYLFVNIVDDTNGITVYKIPQPVFVLPNNKLVTTLVDAVSQNDQSNNFLVEVNSGNLNLVAQNVIALTSLFNIQSSTPTASMNPIQLSQDTNQKAVLREYLVGKLATLSISDISSIKVIASALSETTGTLQQITTKTAVN